MLYRKTYRFYSTCMDLHGYKFKTQIGSTCFLNSLFKLIQNFIEWRQVNHSLLHFQHWNLTLCSQIHCTQLSDRTRFRILRKAPPDSNLKIGSFPLDELVAFDGVDERDTRSNAGIAYTEDGEPSRCRFLYTEDDI